MEDELIGKFKVKEIFTCIKKGKQNSQLFIVVQLMVLIIEQNN